MNPEFSNPLFLLLFCKSVENRTDSVSDISISTVFDNYIRKINYNLSRKYNYYEYIPFVKSVIEEIVKYRLTNNCYNYIKIDEIIDLITKDPKVVSQGVYLLLVTRYIERIGDYCTNIGEEVIYIVLGIREDLNK